jgi:hypothetical protein
MGRGLSKLQEQILTYLQTYTPPHPKSPRLPVYRAATFDVAHIMGRVVESQHSQYHFGTEDGGGILDPAFSVSFTRAVHRLEARGMVERVQWPDPNYNKTLLDSLALTQAGRDWKPGQKAPAPWRHRR